MIRRRRFLGLSGLALGGALLGKRALAISGGLPKRLDAWMPGNLDIHHIDTGRGNSTFILGPDGTTLLIDCGVSNTAPEETAPPRPDASRSPGEWVARYALRHARAARRETLDYMIATHVHPDHVGDVPRGARPGTRGYIETGMSEVDSLMPASKVIDRAFPDRAAVQPPDAPFARNYFAWLRSRQARDLAVEAAMAGSAHQISARRSGLSTAFEARVIAASGRVWTGVGEESQSVFPDLSRMVSAKMPSENQCSIALKFTHGRFTYFTGGDLNADTHDGREPWADIETPAAKVAGRVEVATADHHGYFDAVGPDFVKSLDAQAYIIQAWHLSHPGPAQIERMLGAWPGEKMRDVFALETLPVNRAFNARFVKLMRSTQGHVVVRVAPDGASYRIFVLSSSNEEDEVIGEFGPYFCRSGTAQA